MARTSNGKRNGRPKLKLAQIARLASLPVWIFEDAIDALAAETVHAHHMAEVDKARSDYWHDTGDQLAESGKALRRAIDGR